MRKLVLASANPGKLHELRALLAPLGIEVAALADLALAQADEPHATFLENALAKARHAAGASGLPALADDSGLCVEALGGEPGVQSARYAGEAASDADNNAKLLARLASREDRRAHYYCALVLVRGAHDAQPRFAEGAWHGEIARAPRGANGFGYDPLFLLPARGLTAAELDPAEKNRISHRGIALARMADGLRERA